MENVVTDCLAGLESLKIPCSSDATPSPVPIPVVNGHNPSRDSPSMTPVPTRPLMDEMRPLSGLLRRNMPPHKKLCPAAADPEPHVPSQPVIGCCKIGSTNGKQQ